MRLYHGSPGGTEPMRKCREHAPSHVHGVCWTPSKMTPKEWPFFLDNGAFTGSFDAGEWVNLLDECIEKMPFLPDFVVLPDVMNDAGATMKLHREYIGEVLDRNLPPAPVLQPGLPVRTQVSVYDSLGARVLFVGGECRRQHAHGREIIQHAHDRGLRVHVGNPGGKEAMMWWAESGVDSMDTASIIASEAYDWLDSIEGLSSTPLKKAETKQSSLTAK